MKHGLLLVLFLSTLASCNLVVSEGDDDDDSFDFSLGGVCRVLDGLSTMNCIEFRDGSFTDPQMSTACADYQTDYAAEGADGRNMSFSGVLVECSSSDRVGVCARSNQIIHYYDNQWATGAAESDCTANGGSFN